MRLIKKHASPGVILAVIALVLALAGTAVAITIPRNSVGFVALDFKPKSTTVTVPKKNVNNGIAQAFVKCGNKKKVRVIGGGATTQEANSLQDAVEMVENGQVGNGWYARVRNGNNSNTTALTVTAYCLKRQ